MGWKAPWTGCRGSWLRTLPPCLPFYVCKVAACVPDPLPVPPFVKTRVLLPAVSEAPLARMFLPGTLDSASGTLGTGPQLRAPAPSDFLSKCCLSGKQSCGTPAINESIKAPLKAAASGETENLRRPDLQEDIHSCNSSTWCALAPWGRGHSREGAVPGKPPPLQSPTR